jgi:uncharacterized membrane protein YebE (DUF533 family)
MSARRVVDDSDFQSACDQRFDDLVESVGKKRFAAALGVVPHQISRMQRGAQPNPIARLIGCLQAATPEAGERTLDFIAAEMGGHFVPRLEEDAAMTSAIKEAAEAIAALSDGNVDDDDRREIREAISALESVLRAKRQERDAR